MKAKIIWALCLLMAMDLGGAARNFCGKCCRQGLAPARETRDASACTATACAAVADNETGMESPGLSPVTLFIFQLK